MQIIDLQPTGTDDTFALQQSLDAGACVRVNGDYRITKPIVVRNRSRLEGAPFANILYRGVETEEAAVSVLGQGARVANWTLNCQHKSRGVLLDGVWYTNAAESIRIDNARQIGLDTTRCWNGLLCDIRIVWCHGVAMRCSKHNSVVVRDLQIAHCDLSHDQWPVDLPVDRRACLVAQDHNLLSFENLLCEPVFCGQYPAIYLRGNTTSISCLRFEAGTFTGCHVVVDGDGYWTGTNTSIHNTMIISKTPAEVFLELRGKTRDTVVSQLMASKYLTKGVLRTAGTTHTKYEVQHAFAGGVPDIITQ